MPGECQFWAISGSELRLRRQHTRQALQLLLRDARAGTASVVQAAILGEVAEQQRADVRAAALRISPADNNEFFSV